MCDAWQASNTDGYFAATGSWIEEVSEGHWEEQSMILGFVWMNNAHNGQCLSTALFKICDHLGIPHKIGWVTCDNAMNNTTMMLLWNDLYLFFFILSLPTSYLPSYQVLSFSKDYLSSYLLFDPVDIIIRFKG